MESMYKDYSYADLKGAAMLLKTLMESTEAKLKAAGTDDKPVLQKSLDSLKAQQDEVLRIMAFERTPEASTHTEVSYDSTSQQTRHLSNLLSDVPRFDGANPIALVNFITQVDQIYDINVKGKENVEPIFANAVKNRLSADVYNVLKNSGVETASYSALKERLESHYNTKVTNFQLLGTVFDFVFNNDETYTTKAQKLENQIRATGSHIKTQYKKKHKKDISVDEVLGLVGAQILTEHVRKTNAHIIGHMALHMEDFVNASDVARHAEQIVNRAGEQPLSEKTTFRANHNPKSKPGKRQNGKGQKGKGGHRKPNHGNQKGNGNPNGNSNGNQRGNQNNQRRYDNRDNRDSRDNRDDRDNRGYHDNRKYRGGNQNYQDDRYQPRNQPNDRRAHIADNRNDRDRSRSPSRDSYRERSPSPRLAAAGFRA